MVGTLTLMNMDLSLLELKIAYLANVIGSDMGSLLLPMGTLATLMWMHIIRKGKVMLSWFEYIKITVVVIPPATLFTLVILYYWVYWLFGGALKNKLLKKRRMEMLIDFIDLIGKTVEVEISRDIFLKGTI